MPRKAKAYPHRGWYVTNVGGQRHKLCPEDEGYEAAQVALGKLLDQKSRGTLPRHTNLTVSELVALFLDSAQVECGASTYDGHRHWLKRFCKKHGKRLVKDIKPSDGRDFKNELCRATWKPKRSAPRPYRPGTVNHALMSIKRCWSWAIEDEVIPPVHPFAKIPYLYTESRQRVMTEREFLALLANTDTPFKQFLFALRYTGARPGEIRKLVWDNVDLDRHTFVIHRHKTVKRQRVPLPRVIAFPPVIERMLRWRLAKFGRQGFVFQNVQGGGWNKCTVTERMQRLRKRAGIGPDHIGEELILYTHRHTFVTTAASGGCSGPMLQQLAGHSSASMTARYAHLANADLYQANVKVAESLRPQRSKNDQQGKPS